MMTVIISVIVSTLFGALGPIVSPGISFPGFNQIAGKNLFSQISSNLPKNGFNELTTGDFSEIDPVKSLSNVTIPIDNVLRALKDKLGIGSINDILNGKADIGALKSALDESLGSEGTSDTISNTRKALESLKTIFVLGANILIAVLETAVWIVKGLLGLMTQTGLS
jgi:hypothetical protein